MNKDFFVSKIITLKQRGKKVKVCTRTVPIEFKTEPDVKKPMSPEDVRQFIKDTGLRGATVPGKSFDGDRIHIMYHRMKDAVLTDKQIEEAKRAEVLGLRKDTYTGKLDRIWISKDGNMIITMFVELEREKKFRSFNVNNGEIEHIVYMGR